MTPKSSAKKYLWYGTGLLAADVLLVWALDRLVAIRNGGSLMQGIPLAFCLLHLVTIGVLAVVMIYRKATREIFEARARALEPKLQMRFSEHANGTDQTAPLRSYLAKSAPIVEHSLIQFLPCVKGQGRDNLGNLATELGFVAKWNHECSSRIAETRRAGVVALTLMPLSIGRPSLRAALHDPDPEIQVLAARALVQSGDQEEIQEIFIHSLDKTLRVRASLTEDFRRHATVLCATAVPKVLATGDRTRILLMCEMLGAWRRSIHLDGWQQMFEQSSGSNRAVILRLLPYVSTSEEAEADVLKALADQDQEVKITAAHVAGHWELSSAIPLLAILLSDPLAEVNRAAAEALSKLGNTGQRVLEEAVLGHMRRAGGAALEALEYFNTGRLAGTAL
jgi:HEAT repeats